VGKGSTFTLAIPASAESAAARPKPEEQGDVAQVAG
jgi:hypothetical protein